MSHAPDDYALVIGIDHYPEWSDGAKTLEGPVNDARAFHKWLLKRDGGGLKEENAHLIVSAAKPPAPLQQEIDDKLMAIKERSNGGSRRRFYFYFGGHGHSPAMSRGKQVLCLANWSLLHAPNAALQLDSYVNAAAGCLRFEESLFFIDCCRVRLATPLGRSSEIECGDPKFDDRHHAILYGTDHYTAGYEGAVDDEVRGYFTTALLRILNAQTIELNDLIVKLGVAVPDLARPKIQRFRSVREVDRPIFLGPATEQPPEVGSPPSPPSDRMQPSARLSVTLKTNLKLDAAPREARAPAPGEITLLRGDAIVAAARGAFSDTLPHGDYRILVTHGETTQSHSISLDADLKLAFDLPRRVSAAPLSSTVDKREIWTDPIVDASRWDAAPGEQAIFIVHRTRWGSMDEGINGSIEIESLDDPGDPARRRRPINENRALVRVERGSWLLRFRAPDGAETILPLPVASGWDTQVFLVEEDGRPLLERASILMRPAGKGFDPADALLDAYERAIADLVTGGPGPDPETLHDLLHGKWRNPLFGLAGAHFLVRSLRRGGEPSGLDLLDTVIGNLAELLGGDAPDLVALRLARSSFGGEQPDPPRLSAPPLFRAGYQALVEATADRPDLFENLLDDVALGLLPGSSPWTCWRAAGLAIEGWQSTRFADMRIVREISAAGAERLGAVERLWRGEGFEVSRSEQDRVGRLRGIKTAADGRETSFESSRRMAATPDWLVAFAKDAADQAERNGRALDLAALTRRAGLPRPLLQAAVRIVRPLGETA